MFFNSDYSGSINMVVFDIPTEDGAITVEINVIFVTLVGVEVATSRAKADNGRHAEERGCQHSIGKSKGINGAFLIVKGCDLHILEVCQTGS